MMQKKKIFVSILFLSFFFFILTGCEPNPTKGGDGCGMFDLATEIKITYKEKTYKITEKKKVDQLIKLCREGRWEEVEAYAYDKKDCEVKVEFIGARSTVWLLDDKEIGFLNDMYTVIPDKVYSFIMDEIKKE